MAKRQWRNLTRKASCTWRFRCENGCHALWPNSQAPYRQKLSGQHFPGSIPPEEAALLPHGFEMRLGLGTQDQVLSADSLTRIPVKRWVCCRAAANTLVTTACRNLRAGHWLDHRPVRLKNKHHVLAFLLLSSIRVFSFF